ncbi:MAG: methionyl-tRNA formyltransferase [Sediminibacterium sp.]|jgi:methionyl-tRNA formyltransferase|nr:methionyl-tRNA formyltransferase [Sediminibacterium sp.]
MDNKPRIVFMGTPAFAVASLSALLQAKMNVVGVVTAPDKPAGRGMQLQKSAVKKFALAHDLPILQPEKLKSPEFFEALKQWQPDLQVVVAFRMLPEQIWSFPPMGTLNVHGSLLPQYRGAAPINWAIINGEKETGVTTFQLQHAIDTGAILLQDLIPIAPNNTAGEIHDTMMEVGAQLLVKTLHGLFDNSIKAVPQEQVIGNLALQHAPKIFTKDCEIDWEKPCASIHNLIRGLAPFPGAITKIDGKIVKLFLTQMIEGMPKEAPGSFITDGKTFAKIACKDGYIGLSDIQWEGKKRMPIIDFLRGYRKPT